eukprot:1483944-Rhodomonas_salina.2
MGAIPRGHTLLTAIELQVACRALGVNQCPRPLPPIKMAFHCRCLELRGAPRKRVNFPANTMTKQNTAGRKNDQIGKTQVGTLMQPPRNGKADTETLTRLGLVEKRRWPQLPPIMPQSSSPVEKPSSCTQHNCGQDLAFWTDVLRQTSLRSLIVG